MKKIISIFTLVASLVGANEAFSQQDATFTQYMFNGLTLNPAYAGSHDAISSNFIWRKQWLNIDGAPQSSALSIHSPVGGDKIGVGLQLASDKIGASKTFLGNASASYILPISSTSKLSFGLSAGLDKMDYNFSDLQLGTSNDPNFDATNNISDSKVNFGTGVYYYSKKTFVGLSVPKILENDFTSNNVSYTQKRHIFLYAGHVITIHPNLKFKPNVLVKMTGGATSIDLNANFLIVDKLWLGASYRSLESLDLIAQLNVTNQLGIGYAYDFTTNALKDYSSGSHEFMISYLFSFKKQAMLSPRYF
jgi:type IX secretion system PorP/SprF family membrane protein